MLDDQRPETLFDIGAITTIALGLYVSSHYSYLLFHSLIEIFTVAVGFTLFILTWNTRRYSQNNYLRLLGIGYAFIAVIDLVHTLAYKGLNVFPGYASSNLPTQLWIAARYLQAVTLLTAPSFVTRRLNDRAVVAGFAMAVSVLAAVLFSGRFPDCFIEGKGLTAFKVGSEYVISGVLLLSLYLFYGKRSYFNGRVFFLTACSIVCTILSELAFTSYASVYGFSNMLGHFLKLAAFYLIYRAILVTGLKEPFDLIFRDLKLAEDGLRKTQDTLEEKVRERTEALLRLNRELRAISNCNQVLIRAENESALLHDVCRIVCDEAGYRMAFVGFAEHDDAKTVRPVAWAGVEDGYLDQARLTWADVERGRGPAGTAIRIGETSFIQDFATDLHATPWRDNALSRGYRSLIGLPLKDGNGTPFGVLCIYSAVPRSFSTEEIRLLEELAGDLAFGITVIRIRQEHQRAEEQLGRLAAIVASSDDAIVGKTLDGIITSWNQGAERIYGYTAGEVVGKSISMLIAPGHEDEMAQILDRIKSGEHIEHYESVRQRKDGQQIHMSLTISPVYGPQGQVAAASAVGRDITEKTRLEEQLRQAQKMEAIGQLAGGVAHDFNNILTAIIGFGNLAKMKMKPGDPQQPLIDHILASSDRAAQLTQSLLAFSRKQVLIPKPVDLNTIVKSVEKLLGRLIGEDIEFTTRLAEQSLIVMADAGQIEQVLMNLVTNARDAMPEGGELSIYTEMKLLGKDYADVHGYGEPGRYALITVADTGFGMDEATRGRIFEPFFTTKQKGRGTGLGLSMVYGIVKQHEGSISVYSEPGKGTTFRILLPLVSMEVEESPLAMDAAPSGGTETLLVAEDDQDVRAMTTTVLTDSGYHVIGAVDGKDALDKYRLHSKEIDLLILDVIMPKMGGKEVYDAVKAASPDAKILFISGYTADALHKKGIFDEGVQFLAKPMSPFELLKKVRGILDGRRRPEPG